MLERYPYAKKYWMLIPVHQSSSLMSHARTPSAVGMSLVLVCRGFLRAWTFEESLQQLAPCDTGQAFQLGDLRPWYTGSLIELLTHSDTPWPQYTGASPPNWIYTAEIRLHSKGSYFINICFKYVCCLWQLHDLLCFCSSFWGTSGWGINWLWLFRRWGKREGGINVFTVTFL